jgi:cyclin H
MAIPALILQHVCRELKLPRRVLGAALTYLKRIYLSCCCLEQDPQQLLLTCLYLACKVDRARGKGVTGSHLLR